MFLSTDYHVLRGILQVLHENFDVFSACESVGIDTTLHVPTRILYMCKLKGTNEICLKNFPGEVCVQVCVVQNKSVHAIVVTVQ